MSSSDARADSSFSRADDGGIGPEERARLRDGRSREARQRIAAHKIDAGACLVGIQLLIDRVLRDGCVEHANLRPPRQRQLHRLVDAQLRNGPIGGIGRRERTIPERVGPVRQHQAFQPVLRSRQDLPRRRHGLLEARDLRLRLDHVDRGETAFGHLPFVALHLRLRLTEGGLLIVEIPAREHEIPVGLLDQRQLIHQHLLELMVREVGGAPGDENLVPLDVDDASLKQRLRVGCANRRGKLRIQPEVGVAAEGARRGEVHAEAAAAPQAVAGQRDGALHALLLDLAVRGATD